MQAKSGIFDDAGDYVRDLIRRDRERATAIAEVQAQLDEGFASGMSDRSRVETSRDRPVEIPRDFRPLIY